MAGNQNEGSIYYEVELETAKLISGSRKASEVLGNLDKNARGASSGIDKLGASGDKASGSMGTLKSALSGVASAISVAIIIDYGKAFLTVADNVTQLQSRIARLSTDASQAGVTFAALAQIASISGASLQDTQKLWEKLTSSLKGTGATNSQILFLTDTLQKIGRVGGSSAEEMAAALRQFGQSIDGGTVRAEEFNSVVESMPELARQMAAGMGLSMGQLRQAMLEGKVTAESALNAIAKQSGVVNSEFSKLPRTMDQASNALTVSFSLLIGKMNEATGASKTMVTIIDSISSAIDRLSGRAVTASQSISDLTSTAEMYSRRAKTWSWLGLDGWSEQNKSLAALSTKAATLAGDMDSVAKSSANAANSADGFVTVSTANPKQDNLIKISQRRIELSKVEGEARARLQAEYDAEDAGIKSNDPRVKSLQDQYAEIYRNTQAQKTNNAEGKKSASQAESIAERLASLKEESLLAADSVQGLTREQQLLRAEQSLGAGATDKQKQQARDYKAAALDAADAAKGVTEALKNIPEEAENKNYADSAKSLQAALKADKITIDEFNSASEKAEREHQVNLAKIRAETAAGVTPLQDAQGAIDPVQALANENARKLALIQQFETEKGALTANGLALLNAQNTQYEQARIDAAWQIWENQSRANQMLGDAIDSLQGGATNAITGLLNGTQSLAESFANIGTTILNSVVSGLVEMGLQYVKNMIMGQAAATAALASTAAQATAAAAAWAPAAISASIATMGAASTAGTTAYSTALVASKGLAIAGARKNGGPVSAGSMYQVGEGGMPEIYQASTGKQYMIPGDNGKVISNKDMMGGGGGGTSLNQVMNLTVNTTNGLDDATIKQLRQAWKTDTMLIIKDQQRPRGLLRK